MQGSLRIIVQAYRNLGMTDLAADAERVYAANYPGSAGDIERKKHWWSFL